MAGPIASTFSRAVSTIFGSSAAPAPAQPPGSGTAPTVTLPDGTQSISSTTNVETKPTPSPMDGFSDLWSTTPVDPKAPAPFNPTTIYASANHDKMVEAARRLDFLKNASPEQLAKVAAGGAEGIEGLKALINTGLQDVYAAAMFGSSKLAQAGFDKYDAGLNSTLNTRIPQTIKSLSVSEGLRNANPALNHPGAAPIIQALEQQLVAKYPNATAAEIQQHATDYLSNFMQLANAPQAAAAATKAKSGEEDWSGFIN